MQSGRQNNSAFSTFVIFSVEDFSSLAGLILLLLFLAYVFLTGIYHQIFFKLSLPRGPCVLSDDCTFHPSSPNWCRKPVAYYFSKVLIYFRLQMETGAQSFQYFLYSHCLEQGSMARSFSNKFMNSTRTGI